MPTKLAEFQAGTTSYYIGSELLFNDTLIPSLLRNKQGVILAPPSIKDTHLAKWNRQFKDCLHNFPLEIIADGETAKCQNAVDQLIGIFEKRKINRSSLIIIMGGGTLTDLVGFAASIYKRGIKTALIPTTLTAQIDAAIGGKTGINLPYGKNLLGTFHNPEWIIIDPSLLATLPQHHLLDGTVEMLKSQLLIDPHALLDQKISSTELITTQKIRASVLNKLTLIGEDHLDQTGKRALLNLGHTLGHALEVESQYQSTHGQCVAAGLLFALQLSKEYPLATKLQKTLEKYFKENNIFPKIPKQESMELLLLVICRDKKNTSGNIQFVLFNSSGKAMLTAVDSDFLKLELELFLTLYNK